SVRFNDGSGNFTVGATLTVGDGPYYSPVLADLNGDGALDMVIANQDSDNLSIYFLNSEERDYAIDLDISSKESAEVMLSVFDNALDNLAASRANIGAALNRLESAANVSSVTGENLAQAKSTILD